MQNIVKNITVVGLLSTLLVTISIAALAQSQKPELPKTPPNVQLKVQRQSGKCPQTFGLWTGLRYYEGGGQHTVIADTYPIARAAKLVISRKKVAEFTAPLKPAFASCVGQARYQELPYRVRFGNGNVTFRVELPPDTPANPSGFDVRAILATRPYVLWSIAD